MKYTLYINDIPSGLIKSNQSLAIDTEAMGLNVLRDRLCLVQIGDESGAIYLVKFDGTDYSAPNLRAMLLDESIEKMFHFARFDVAILRHYLNIPHIPSVFCTKIASKLSRTYTDAHGLKAICKDLLGVEISKESQSSNWGAPTLTDRQLQYAASDVIHLHKLKAILVDLLIQTGRMTLARELFQALHTICTLDIVGFDAADMINH